MPNYYFRPVCQKSINKKVTRSPEMVAQILERNPDMNKEILEKPYEMFSHYESSRKSCPSCGCKLEEGEFVWSCGLYIRAKWNTVFHCCKNCYKDMKKQHMDPSYDIKSYQGADLPEWLR